jgi:hypothetical protein
MESEKTRTVNENRENIGSPDRNCATVLTDEASAKFRCSKKLSPFLEKRCQDQAQSDPTRFAIDRHAAHPVIYTERAS